MSDLFISYSRADGEVAERLAGDLKNAGFSVFYDQDLLPGEDFESRLGTELRKVDFVLVLLSPSYVGSAWARRELEMAAISEAENGPRIIPVLIQETDLPPYLRGRLYADLRQEYEKGLDLIKKAIGSRRMLTRKSKAVRDLGVPLILSLMGGLLASALSALFTVDLTKLTPEAIGYTIGIAIACVLGGTFLIAAVHVFRKRHKAGSVEYFANSMVGAYVQALENSDLNPVRGAADA